MTGTARRADYLHLHANVSRRVRNLETGVHPTGAEAQFADIVPPTMIPVISPWNSYASGTTAPAHPQWQRRFGIVTLMGGVEPDPGSGGWPAISADAKVGTLPAGARPLTELMVIVPATGPPYYVRLRVEPDGDLYLMKTSDTIDSVRFDGATWTND